MLTSESLPSLPFLAGTGIDACTTDYITIPGGKVMDPDTKEMIHTERFCGSDFPEVKCKLYLKENI